MPSLVAQLHAIIPIELDPPDEDDQGFVLGPIRSQLLTLETMRPWEKDLR